MKISIYSLQSTLFDGEAEKLIAKTPLGEMTVLDHHLPILTSLVGPEVKIIDKESNETIIKIVSGFLEVQPDSRVVILSNPI